MVVQAVDRKQALATNEGVAPVDDAFLARGTMVGRFVVLGLLGKGGMGEVYAAHDPQLDRKVAIKLLRGAAESASEEGRVRLMREAQAIARVSHPNVVVVYDVGTHGGRVFIAMELVEGHTLRYWMHARSRTWPEVLEVFTAAGRGLAAAHEREMVHRDFKPDNVMIAANGQVRVMDFGLVQLGGGLPAASASLPHEAALPSRRAWVEVGDEAMATRPVAVFSNARTAELSSVQLTHTGAALGTPAYMAPEQFRDEPTDARTDQFSFCVSLYEALYGEPPFQAATVHDLAHAVCNGQVREAPQGSQTPGWLREVVLRGLRGDPSARWPSMNALLGELERQPAVASRRRFVLAAATKLTGIWEAPAGDRPVETAAKAHIRAAFLSTGKVYAEKAWENTASVLDQYAKRWCELYVEACEATHVRGEQSSEVLDLRMECLREGLQDLEALVRQLRNPTAEVVERAVSAAHALGNLERCENIALLRAVVRPPSDPAARVEVERLRRELAEVRALGSVGRINDASAMVERLERAARQVGYGPLLAEVLLAMSRLLDDKGAKEEAARSCEDAFMTAISCGHDETAAEAGTLLLGGASQVMQQDSAREVVCEIWSRLTESLLRRVGGHELLWGWLHTSRAVLCESRGDATGALRNERLSLAVKEKVLGPDHPDVGISIGNIAVFLDHLGRVAEAVVEAKRAAEITERGFGPGHPRTGLMLSNYGEFLARSGQWDEATAIVGRALDIFERETDPEGPYVLVSLTALGTAHLGAGRVAEALLVLERACRIAEKSAPSVAHRGQARFMLARALDAPGEQCDLGRSLMLARQARADYEESSETPANQRELAAIISWLAERSKEKSLA